MSTLFDRTIAESYTELLKTASASGVTSTLTVVEDGDATASALQISTSTVKSSGTLEVVGQAILSSSLSVTGASTLTGNVTMGGDLTVTGNAVIQGTLTANGGTLTLGDADTDNVVFNADVNSHILPNTDNTYDLGSASKSWRNLFVDSTATVNTLSITGSQTVSATTQSTDKDTGALVVEGGVGVEKNVNVGGNLAVTGTTALTGNTTVSGTLGVTGATTLSSTLGVTGAANLASTLGVSDTISATKATGTGLAVTANATIGGNLTVSGDFTVNGTTTNINTTNLVVEDKNVVLADVATPTNTTADGGGITLKGATDKTLNWVNSTGSWTSSENVDVASGKTYKVNGTDVLSATSLGTGVTGSSLTSVGNIGTGTWQGTIVSPTYGGTGVNNASRTITLGGNLTTSGAFNTTLTATGATNVTLPTTGTLATLAGTETLTNKTINLANNTLQATSAQIATAVTDETGTGSLVFSASPALTGTPTAPTAAADTNTTQIATTAHVFAERSNTATLTNKSLNLSSNTLIATSAQVASAVTDETGTGALVFGTSPTLTTPVISSIVNTGTLTLPTSTDTLVGRATTDILTNKTINLANNTLQATSAQVAAAVTDETGTGSLVFSNSPTLVTPTLGAASATSLTLTNALSVANGGTGRTSMGGANTFLAVDATNTGFTNKTLSAGTGINISDVSNVVTISATGGGGGGGGGSASGAVAIYRYNATAGQTVFSGADASTPSSTLVYTPNYVNVFVNGVKLDDSDFTATNGTSITLATACVLNDDVDIVAFGAVPQLASPGLANYVVGTNSGGTSLEYKQLIAGTGVSIAQGTGSVTISASGASPISAPLAAFRYIASAGQTVFNGVDTNGNTLAFTPGFLYVFVNGVLLAPTLDYTTTSTTTVTLVSGCSLSDFVDILAFGQVTSVGLTDASVTTAKVNDSAITTAKINDSAVTTAKLNNGSVTTAKLDQTAGSEAVTTATIRDGAVTAAKLAAGAAVPSQTGNAGKYLTTNGSTASWQTSPVGFRNRIINGDMRIDQRNAGASVTSVNGVYSVDRWQLQASAPKFSAQQSSTSPVGFQNSMLITSLSSYTVTSGDFFAITQPIEGFNISDLAWGTSSASSVTLSFWVRSSITGTFGGSIACGSGSYPFTYSIPTSNTFTKITINIPANTSYSPTSITNGVGIYVFFGFGVGSTYSGSAGSWQSGFYESSTGAASIVGTNGATFYITGVQLEAGSTATDFERRPYGTELALCQRYYETGTIGFTDGGQIANYGTGGYYSFVVTKRVAPTSVIVTNSLTANVGATATIWNISTNGIGVYHIASSSSVGNSWLDTYTASAEL